MKVIHPVDLSSWKTLGKRITKMRVPFLTTFLQHYEHPVSQKKCHVNQFELGNYVVVMPITPEGDIILIQSWKPGVQKVRAQFPSGQIKEKQSIQQAAAERLLVETGYVADSYEVVPNELDFFDAQSPSWYSVVIARGVVPAPNGLEKTGHSGVIQVEQYSQQEFKMLLQKHELHEPSTYVALIYANLRGWIML